MFERVREIHRETESGTFLFCESLITRFNSLQGAQITAGIVLLLLLLLLLLLSLCLSLSHSLSLSLSRAVLSHTRTCTSSHLPASVASSWRTQASMSVTRAVRQQLSVCPYMCVFLFGKGYPALSVSAPSFSPSLCCPSCTCTTSELK